MCKWTRVDFRHQGRVRGYGCPYCAGNRLLAGFNDLNTRYPDLAREWHPDVNDRTTQDVTAHSRYRAWWHCTSGHSWRATVSSRVSGHGCPFCSGRFPIQGVSDLVTLRPELAAQWGPDNSISPFDVTISSNRKIWWRCQQSHHWQAVVSDRSKRNHGCPTCGDYGTSKRERAICGATSAALGFDYLGPEHVRGWPKEVDLALHEIGVVVEYDGWYWHRNSPDRDNRKTIELQKHGWKVIRVRETSQGRALPPLNAITLECTEVEDPAIVARRVVKLIQMLAQQTTGAKSIPKPGTHIWLQE